MWNEVKRKTAVLIDFTAQAPPLSEVSLPDNIELTQEHCCICRFFLLSQSLCSNVLSGSLPVLVSSFTVPAVHAFLTATSRRP